VRAHSKRVSGGLLAATLASIFAAAAAAAPVNTSPPTISGKFRFGETVKCNPGTWSGDPVSFGYAWGSPSLTKGTAQSFFIEDTYFSAYPLGCTVTATDAAGATGTAMSPAAVAAPGVPSLKLTSVKALSKGRIAVKGKVGPAAMVKVYGKHDYVTVTRPLGGKRGNLQLGDLKPVRADGTFSITVADDPGRRKIEVTYTTDNGQIWGQAKVLRTVKVTKGRTGGGGTTIGIH
jgi:hypothetical protein